MYMYMQVQAVVNLMVKMDIKSAYRMVPIHPHDRRLFGMMWEDKVCGDPALPFELSHHQIHSAIVDALEWIAKNNRVQYLWHYLDDYLTCNGEADSDECRLNLELPVDIYNYLSGSGLMRGEGRSSDYWLSVLWYCHRLCDRRAEAAVGKAEQVASSNSGVAR